MSYQYTRLQSGQTRLLKILNTEPRVEISLCTYDREQIPAFIALSYTWGKEGNTETVKCNDKEIKITPYLLNALVDIHSNVDSSSLWIDAICINQKDEQEKAKEVANMGLLYQTADKVLVYLGGAKEGSDKAMTAIEHAKDYENPLRGEFNLETLQEILTNLKRYSNSMFDPSEFKPIAALGRRSWFGRLWICQEYILGRSVSFQCGRMTVSEKTLNKVLSAMSICSFGCTEPADYQEEPNLFEGFANLRDMKAIKQDRQKSNEGTFFKMVMLGRERETTERIDHVYAALGLAEGSDSIYKENIHVNYSQERRNKYWLTYTDFGKLALCHEPHLRLLQYNSSDTRPKDLPSWCPNLNSTMITSVMDPIYAAGWPSAAHTCSVSAMESSEDNTGGGHLHFKGDKKCHVEISPSSNIVKVWGTAFDHIQAVGPACSWIVGYDSNDLSTILPFARNFVAWVDTCLNLCAKAIQNDDLAPWIFEDVFIGATNRDSLTEGEESGSRRITVLQTFTMLLSQIVAYEAGSEISHASEHEDKLKASFERFLAWIEIQQQIWSGRIFFTTRKGRLGWASDDVRVGDETCMLYSGPTLYILRPQETENRVYQFVSDSFMLGYVNGEVFDMLDSGEAKEEFLCIE